MSPLILIICVAILLVLFGLSAFFSGSETVLFSLSPIQVQHIRTRDPLAGSRLEQLLDDSAVVLSTIIVGNTLVNFASASLGFVVLRELSPRWGPVIAVPLMTILVLLFGEVTPKRIAINHAERLAPLVCRLLLFWMHLLKPLSMGLVASSRVFKESLRRERRSLTDDELLTVVEIGEEQGMLDSEEAFMVDGIMRLSELKASDEMTPRIDIVGIDLEQSLESQLHILRTTPHRYLPLYRRTPDTIEKFLDVFRYRLEPERGIISERVAFDAYFVPENVALDDLLVSFQSRQEHIACVLDEYGGTAGIITRGDILDLIAAPVAERTEDAPPSEIIPDGDDRWLIDGTASLEEINRRLDLDLDADDADRIAGWVTLHAGAVPDKPGLVVEAQGCRVTVTKVRRHRVQRVQLEVLQRPALDDDDDPLDEPEDMMYEHAEEGELK